MTNLKRKTVYDLFLEEIDKTNFLTSGIKEFDSFMNGGFRAGTITELTGLPSSGKSQLCYTVNKLFA